MMQYAICNELFQGWPLVDVLHFVAEVGYEGLELAPFTLAPLITDLSSSDRRAIRDAARDQGVVLTGLHWLLAGPPGLHIGHPDATVRSATLRYLRDLIGLAVDLEAPILVFGSPRQRSAVPPQTPEQATERFIEGLRLVAGDAERAGVTICVEPLPAGETDVVNTLEQALSVVTAVDSSAVRLILDVKSMCAEGQAVSELVRRYAPYAAHFHANDANRGAPGSGSVDFRPILAALSSTGYSGWISVEVFDMSAGAEAIARDSLRYLHDCSTVEGAPADVVLPPL